MYSGLRPSIEIINTGAACAASAKTISTSGKITKRRRAAFMRSAPPSIVMGTDEAVRTLKLNSQASGDEACGGSIQNDREQGTGNREQGSGLRVCSRRLLLATPAI